MIAKLKWKKFWIILFVVGIIMNGTVFSFTDFENMKPQSSNWECGKHGHAVSSYDYIFVIIQILSIIGILMSLFSILHTKIKNKKENIQNKVKKSIKVLFIVSVILLLLITFY